MKIYLVVFIAQLKSAFEIENSYSRARNFNLSSIIKKDSIAINLYKIETLFKKCESYDKIKYLVK